MKINWNRIIENLITLFIGTICMIIIIFIIKLIN